MSLVLGGFRGWKEAWTLIVLVRIVGDSVLGQDVVGLGG